MIPLEGRSGQGISVRLRNMACCLHVWGGRRPQVPQVHTQVGGGGKSITGLDDAAQAIRQSSGAPALVYWGLRGVKTKSLVASRYSMVLKGLET